MKNSWKLFICLLFVFGVSSCSLPTFKREKVQNYMLWYQFDSQKSLCKSSYNVLLRPISSNNSLNTTFMLVLNNTTNMASIPYCRWKIPLPQMVDELIYRDLSISKIFYSVSKSPIYDYDIIISTHIFSFWIDLSPSPTLKAELLFEVSQRYEGDNSLLFKNTYEVSRSLNNLNPEEYATVASEATKEIIQHFLEELCDVLQRNGDKTKK